MRRILRFDVDPGSDGERLDRFVPSRSQDVSRSLLRKVVDLGGVHVDGRRVRKCSMPVRSGSRIEVYFDGLPLDPFRLRESDILFQDKYLMAINKLPGVESQPTHARFKGTLYESLLCWLQDPKRPQLRPSLGMVQRLDRDTSGVMAFSIHPRSHKGMTQSFAGRSVVKVYQALVSGNPFDDEGEIRSLLARQRKTNRVKTVTAGGKEAITRFKVLERFDHAALLRVEILTGRSHQIRAHLSEQGFPLLGDKLYEGPTEICGISVPRQMLHASHLSFNHPVNGYRLDLDAPLASDMASLLAQLRSGS